MSTTKKRPLVSICAVCYNHAKYLEQALKGFLAQRGAFEIEILIHDDASTDGSADIIRRYAARYPDKIFPILQEENQYSRGRQNISGIFNFPRARGKYIALMDCDDYWCNPDKLERQVRYLESHPDCSMTVHAAAVQNDRGELVNRNLMRPYRGDRDLSPAELVDKAGSFPFGAMLLRREVVEKLPDWYFRCPVGDRPLELLSALKGYCHYADRFDSVYRFHGSGSWTEEMKSGDFKKKQDRYARAMRELYRAFDRESGGRYHREAVSAARRVYFLTRVNLRDYGEIFSPRNRRYYRELPLRDRCFIRAERELPFLFAGLRRVRDRIFRQEG